MAGDRISNGSESNLEGMAYSRPRPMGLLRVFLRAPVLLYRIHLGWMLGHRFLLLTHRGRRTGKTRRNVVEVFHHDREKRESFVMSGWGAESDWYLNILKNGPISVHTAHEQYAPYFRILSKGEARRLLTLFSSNHPTESRFFLKSFFRDRAKDMGFETIAELVPLVAFRPKEDSKEGVR